VQFNRIKFVFLLLCFIISNSFVEAKMIGQWTFEQSNITDNKVKDAVGNLDGTIIGEFSLNTQVSSLVLDGKTNYVSIAEKGKSVNLPNKEISAEAWLSLNSGTQWGSIINYSQDNGSFEKGWLLGYNNTSFNFAVSTSGRLIYLTSSTAFEIGQWYHVVGTFDGSVMKIYLNGKLEKTQEVKPQGNIDYADSFYTIGSYKDDDEFFPMDGSIHEVRVYDTVLTENEVLKNYESKKELFPEKAELALGPYLKFIDTDSAVIKWQTDEPSPSILSYGEKRPEENRISDSTPKTQHEVTITELKPNTIYYYIIQEIKNNKTYISKIYECDTFFNYNLHAVPEKANPYISDVKDDKGKKEKEEKAKLYSKVAEHIIDKSGVTQGYCLVLGAEEGQLAYELAKITDLNIIGVDVDSKKIAQARKKLKDAGIYGSRVTIYHVESFSKLPFTRLFANLIVSDSMLNQGECISSPEEVYDLLCPKGIAYLGQFPNSNKKLTQESLKNWLNKSSIRYEITADEDGLWLKFERTKLLGSGEWSHQYGSPDNSANSGDSLQGASSTQEMEVQWVGRPGPRAQADRNGRKHSPLAINGRLFVQGLERIIALDAYNGSILWSREIPEFRRFNIPRDSSNWCADENYVYAALKENCLRLDAENGNISKIYDLIPGDKEDWNYDWGYIARYNDKLFGTAVKKGTSFKIFWGGYGWYDATSGPQTYKVCSENIFALNRETGETSWVYQDGVIINSTITIAAGRVYFVECRNDKVKASDSRRVGMEELWNDQYLVALNSDNGDKLWEKPINTVDGIVMFHMAYANNSLFILSSSNNNYNLYAYNASTGKEKWEATQPWMSNNHGGHMSRPAIVGNTLCLRPYTFNIESGELLDIRMPGGGCGTYCASTSSVIFRAGNVTMWDINTQNTSSWHRLRPGCWLSTIPACGLVLSPEAGGGCSCGSWMETSIAFAPLVITDIGGETK